MKVDGCTACMIAVPFVQENTSVEPTQRFECLATHNLRLRAWQDDDIQKIHSIMQDPEVNKYLRHHKLDEYDSIVRLAEKSKHNISEHRYGYFICEHIATGEVIGMVGLNYVEIDAPHFPCYTVSWIISKSFWGNGYATEAAKALIKYGFETIGVSAIYACTTAQNAASENVMKRLEMNFVRSFDFPGINESDPFCNHVLYVKEREVAQN